MQLKYFFTYLLLTLIPLPNNCPGTFVILQIAISHAEKRCYFGFIHKHELLTDVTKQYVVKDVYMKLKADNGG